MKNPSTLAFGKSPINYIERVMQKNEIIDNFSDENPPYQVCMVTGVRGAGKTVILTEKSSANFSVYRDRLIKKGVGVIEC